MLKVFGESHARCDGVSRRSFVAAGALGLAGFGLGDLLRLRAEQAGEGQLAKDTSVILVWKGGGPSHIDMWDLKPEAPAEFRGEFSPISTNVPGIQISEHLPLSAKQMDKFSILRSVTHPDANHGSATHYLLTGHLTLANQTAGTNETPSCQSIIAKQRGPRRPGLPAYIAVPNAGPSMQAAYLGVGYNPFSVGRDPNLNDFSVRNLTLPNGFSLERLQNRRNLLTAIDTIRRDMDQTGLMDGLDSFTQKAFEMVTSPASQKAFDIAGETPEMRDLYGRHTIGQSMLLARRLVESGVTCVTVNASGWDTHANNFSALKTTKLPQFDQAWAALMQDMYQRGMMEKTLVLVCGEFGRTPRVNTGAGRDHWPGAQSIIMAGGGLKSGLAIGETDPRAEYPRDRPLSPEDVLSTMYDVLGVDQDVSYVNDAERPLKVLPHGRPIKELVG